MYSGFLIFLAARLLEKITDFLEREEKFLEQK